MNGLFFSISYYYEFIFEINFAIYFTCFSILIIAYQFIFYEKSLLSIINIFNGFSILFLYGNVINYLIFSVESFNVYYLMEGVNISTKYFISSLFLINTGHSLINITYLNLSC